MAILTRPEHVPDHLIVDLDIYNLPGASEDPQVAWRAFRGKGPLVFSPYNGGHWVATSGKDNFKFYSDPKHFSSDLIGIPDPGVGKMIPIQKDPPSHSGYRANIQSFFTPAAIEEYTPYIRSRTISLIEGFHNRGKCEFVSDFALRLPLEVFLEIMGLPLEDREYLRHHVEIFVNDADPVKKEIAFSVLQDYIDQQLRDRLDRPQDDKVTHITRFMFQDRQYSFEEMRGTLQLLLFAGLDTVAMMLSFIAMHMARHPHDRHYVREHPERMHAITQELLRRYAGPNLGRVVANDFTYKGVDLKAGDRLILVPSLFNMDEAELDDPDRVDFERNARHITFGAGPHTCAGALLARREIAIFLEEWLIRIPDFQIIADKPLSMRASQQNAVQELWLAWETA